MTNGVRSVAKLNALWWWIDRWRKSTAFTDMTLEEQGAYRNLLDEANLRGGPLPDDERILAKASGDALAWPRLRKTIMARFVKHADGWRNETLDSVLHASSSRAERQRRWRQNHNGGHNGDRNARHNEGHSPSPSPSPSPSLISGSGSGSPQSGKSKVRGLSGRGRADADS